MQKNKHDLKFFLNFLKNHWLFVLIFITAIVLHILVFKELGYKYNLDSDDLSYVEAGITLYETGKLTMHGVLSAQIMPGMAFIIALFCLIFGTGSLLWLSLKIFWIVMGLTSMIYLYQTIRLYYKSVFAAIPCIFFLSLDYVWMNNIILTETPFILSFLILIYHSLKFARDKSNKEYIKIILWYIISLFIRPNIALFPIFLLMFLLLKKFDWKYLLKKALIAGIVVLITLLPWTYRNYKLFDSFIPLTYGAGNPLLLGTYQGYNCPSDKDLDYKKNVDEKLSSEMYNYLYNDPKEKSYLKKYYSLEYDGLKAKYRMHEWWKKDKISMLKSYFFYKPKELIYSSFYWQEVLNISANTNLLFRKIEIILFSLSTLIIFIKRKYLKEFIFLMTFYFSQIALYAYTFAFSRYAISLFFLRYIIIGFGISTISEIIKKRGAKNESINDNSRI